MWGKDEFGAFDRQDSCRLDVTAVCTNDHAELESFLLKNRKLASRPEVPDDGKGLAVLAEDLSVFDHRHRIVELTAASFVESHHERRLEMSGPTQHLSHLR